MSQVELEPVINSPVDPCDVADGWLQTLGRAIEDQDGDLFATLFDAGGYWKDMLSFTWARKTFAGPEAIRNGFEQTAKATGASNVRLADGRSAPRFSRRSGQNVLEVWFDFDTAVGTGAGFARLLYNEADPSRPKIWLLLTTLQEFKGFKARTGLNRPTGEKYSKIESPENWKHQRDKEQSFDDRDPEVIIIGGGHSGLMLAARLRQMGVDVLVIEKAKRVGDNWRRRYNNLTLHNEIDGNHFPYLPFPETWPVWLPKDMIGNWLESYADFLELNVWTDTQLKSAAYDGVRKTWKATVMRADGSVRTLTCKHMVAAVGVSGGAPKKPEMPGLTEFKGTVLHSGEFGSGKSFAGKRALVMGTGNSGHDIAQDLYVSGAQSVTIMQRGATCVLSLEPSATISYSIYRDGLSVEDVDLMVAAIPYDMLIESYQWITKKTTELDAEMLKGLSAAGFRTHLGEDATGFQLLYLRGAGGYYIDVGCSQLIIQGKIPVIQADNMDRFVADGLRMNDGHIIPCDLVVLATGFQNMQESIRGMFGDEVADRVGPIWGFDDEGNMRNIWTRTAQEGFWVMGGAILEARLNSRFLALEIKAALEGLTPATPPALKPAFKQAEIA
jgi:cation diffusion facilitator CzcD-associated flavoprotein CzcO